MFPDPHMCNVLCVVLVHTLSTHLPVVWSSVKRAAVTPLLLLVSADNVSGVLYTVTSD